jgi:hypothetical protein
MAKTPRRKPIPKRVVKVMWSCAGLFAIGYFPTAFLQDPRVSMVMAAGVVIPFGVKATTIPKGTIRGALLGLIAGLGIMAALSMGYSKELPAPSAANYMALGSGAYASTVPGVSFVTHLGMSGVLIKAYGKSFPGELAFIYIAGTVVMCAMSATLFAFLGERRKQRIEDQWKGQR